MSRWNTILLDWARVLHDVSWRFAARALQDVVGFEDKARMQGAFFPALLERERGAMEADVFWSAVVQSYGMEPTSPTIQAFVEAYQQVAGGSFPEMLALLRELRQTRPEWTLAILSNGAPEVMEVAERSEERTLVDHAFYSCLMKVRKPKPEAFLHVTQALKTTPEQVFFIDDQLKNVEAARELGMTAFHFQGIEDVQRLRKSLLSSP